MTDGRVPRRQWVADLPGAGGGSLEVVAGGLLVTGPDWMGCYTTAGERRWVAPVATDVLDPPVVLDDATIAQIESDAVVIRDCAAGVELSRWAAPRSSSLAAAPWGDLLLTHTAEGLEQSVRCLTRAGVERWSVSLSDERPRLTMPFFTVGDMVVIPRYGVLWAYGRNGRPAWVADRAGVRAPRREDDLPKPRAEEVRVADRAIRIDHDRVVVELSGQDGSALVEIDGRGPAQRTVAEPVVLRPPVTVLPRPGDYLLAGFLGQVDIGHMDYVYPIRVLASDGSAVWEHRLPARGKSLAATPDGGVVAGAGPSAKVWREYGKWQDLSGQTFARLIDAAGAEVWTWYAPGLITQAPVAGPDGVVYVGSEGRLFALASGEAPS